MSEVRNRLGDETSPYLRQHADNPVAWYPWGDEALRRARREDRPIFLSVGYSACHWCHVMERESFEDREIAERLNEAFVNIKVDREERPDLDRIYMDAVQLMTGQGGWPMSVWLTPDLEPFYAGTYFPPKSKWGRPGFVDVVEEVRRVWSEERDRVEDIADEMAARLHKMAQPGPSSTSIDRGPIRSGADALSRRFDPSNGGFGTKPKFPAAGQCRLLFRVATDDDFSNDERQRARDMAETTLVHMASGGMYDHLGGGFHRYSTDARWLVPHFEKMLYDNALLLNTYREGWELTGRPYFRRIVEETGQYVLREMVDSADSTGAFSRRRTPIPRAGRASSLCGLPNSSAMCWGRSAAEKQPSTGASATTATSRRATRYCIDSTPSTSTPECFRRPNATRRWRRCAGNSSMPDNSASNRGATKRSSPPGMA